MLSCNKFRFKVELHKDTLRLRSLLALTAPKLSTQIKVEVPFIRDWKGQKYPDRIISSKIPVSL